MSAPGWSRRRTAIDQQRREFEEFRECHRKEIDALVATIQREGRVRAGQDRGDAGPDRAPQKASGDQRKRNMTAEWENNPVTAVEVKIVGRRSTTN
jgi:hypothetical protein